MIAETTLSILRHSRCQGHDLDIVGYCFIVLTRSPRWLACSTAAIRLAALNSAPKPRMRWLGQNPSSGNNAAQWVFYSPCSCILAHRFEPILYMLADALGDLKSFIPRVCQFPSYPSIGLFAYREIDLFWMTSNGPSFRRRAFLHALNRCRY